MRWIGGDDWLEPDYARKCIEVLEARPDLIGVTTYFDFRNDDGSVDYAEYKGKRLDLPKVHQRFNRMAWFMCHNYHYMDPIYTMMRRDALQKTGGHRMDIIANDQVLSMEISVLGAFGHVPECLAHRSWPAPISMEDLIEQNFKEKANELKSHNFFDEAKAFWMVLSKHETNPWVKFLCLRGIVGFYLTAKTQTSWHGFITRLRLLKRSLLQRPALARSLSN